MQTIHALRSQLTVFRFDETTRRTEIIDQISNMLSRVELIERYTVGNAGTFKRLDLAELIEANVENRENRWDRERIQINVAPNVIVKGDAAGLTAVITELLDNALRYSDADVRVTSMSSGDMAQVTVQDSGPGIPKLIERQAMRPFVSLYAERNSTSGLGLAIAQAVVQRHNGTLSLTSNNGARIVLSIPLAQ